MLGHSDILLHNLTSIGFTNVLDASTKDQAIKYFRDSKKEKFVYGDSNGIWKNLGFMGHNFLYNDDGIVFSLPLALSQEKTNKYIQKGSESGTIILKTETGKRFLQFYYHDNV